MIRVLPLSSWMEKSQKDSKEYNAILGESNSIVKTAGWARSYLTNLAKKLGPDNVARSAIVLDIDDTVLTFRNGDYNDPVAIKPMKSLYDHAIKKGFPVYFVTARSDTHVVENGKIVQNRDITHRELNDLGYTEYENLFLMPKSAPRDTKGISEYKRKARQQIYKESRIDRIVLNVGDRWHDLLLFPNGDRVDGKISAHKVKTKTLADGLLSKLNQFKTYVGIMPDISEISIKLNG